MMASNNGELYWSFRKFARGPNSSRKAHHGSMLNKANRVTLGYLPLYHHWLWLPNSSTGWYRPIKTSSMVIVGFSGEFLLFLKPPSSLEFHEMLGNQNMTGSFAQDCCWLKGLAWNHREDQAWESDIYSEILSILTPNIGMQNVK